MGRFLGPKLKVSRRLGQKLFDRNAEDKYLPRRSYPPGVHGPQQTRVKLTDYAIQLREKQKAKRIYGLLERQFRKYVEHATGRKGNSLVALQNMLERRLDNVVYRFGFAKTRGQARQLVSHRHVRVNGKIVNIPSYDVAIGDTISLKEKTQGIAWVNEHLQSILGAQKEIPAWLSFDSAEKIGKMVREPAQDDVQLPFDIKKILEFYSR